MSKKLTVSSFRKPYKYYSLYYSIVLQALQLDVSCMTTKDITMRNVDAETYEEFSAEAQRSGLSVGEAVTRALQSWLTQHTEIKRDVESTFDPEAYKIADQPLQIEFYESSTCPHCPEARRSLTEAIQYYSPKFIGLSLIDVSKPEGLREAEEKGLSAVPSTILKIKIVGAHPRLREKIVSAIKLLEM